MLGNNHLLTSAIRLALVASTIALMPTAAIAQDSDEANVLDQIEVTGTRLNSPGVIANSPIASYSSEELQQKQSVTVEEFLRLVPGAVPAIGSGVNNGNGGGATINLRGLGANRGLILVNGRRVVPFNLLGAVDTNVIPIAMIERIDLVTGGASAVYGADAVSGVINFILKRDFEGVELATQFGTSEEGDADRQRSDLIMGANLANGRGNVVMSIGRTETDELLQGSRPIGVESLSSVSGNPEGSGTTVPARIGGVPGLPGTNQIGPDGSLVPTYALFNFNPLNLYQTPQERLQATAYGHFELTEGHEAYAEMLYTRSDVFTQLAPSGSFLNTFEVPVGNPFIPQPMRQQMCAGLGISDAECTVGNTQTAVLSIGRRLTELGPRLNNFENKMFQGTVGVRGELNDNWNYDAYWSFGESDQIQTRGNWGSLSRTRQALMAVDANSCLDPSNGCVPLNIFGPEGSISQDMIDFINLDALLGQTVEQNVGGASVSGDLGDVFSVFWSDYPISLAVGVEYREVEASTKSDQASQIQGEVLGTGAPTPDRGGRFELKEAFAEFFVPIVNDAPWAYSLSAELGYRYTEFSTDSSRGYDTFKYGGEWAPTENFRVRALAQRASRAPNVNELFQPAVTALANLAVDPCQLDRINQAEANTPGTLSNLCRQTGVPLSQIGSLEPPSAGQVNVLSGGNTALSPEVADTLTFGVVWQPSFSDSLALTLDYYDIELEQAITTPTITDVMSQCYDPAFNPNRSFNAACALVGRHPLNGSFNGSDAPGVGLLLSNQGKVRTDGIDLGLNYGLSLNEWGSLDFALNWNHVLSWDFQATPTSVNRNCVGYYSIACNGAAGIIYRNRSNLRTTWSLDDVSLSLNWRRSSSVIEEPGGQAFLPEFSSISAYNYFDLAAAWQVNDRLRLNLSIDNLLDKAAPNVGNTIGSTTFNSGNTYPQFYDVVGRYYTLGATIKF
ncbi:TonB-dependent receptor plug domain-containing protein [Pseudomarimonas arenosa]|uniref:TonB-dependent receptor n=1 Tax=Pseudomarimonas arenosa TaxID=2774145 RepID=A0AAW3ZPU0_9GAMM|nr:TonB-dependent receptor [Pseudomarimonas arenosa]MBD8528213.1 TonB-dependent receptor [Pseudomarimonas arenosa]